MFELLIKWTHWLFNYYSYVSANKEMEREDLTTEKVQKYSADFYFTSTVIYFCNSFLNSKNPTKDRNDVSFEIWCWGSSAM